MVVVIFLPITVFCVDWGEEEHIFSGIRRPVHAWWQRYTELDVADVAKANSVRTGFWRKMVEGPQLKPGEVVYENPMKPGPR